MNLTRVTCREGRTTHPNQNENPIGWFATKSNIAFGWTISRLEQWEKDWFASQDVSTDNVFRIHSECNTCLVRFNFETGTVAFFDNQHLTDTDEIRFERAIKYNRVIIDDAAWTELFGYERIPYRGW